MSESHVNESQKKSGVKRRDFLKILGVSGRRRRRGRVLPENAGKLIPYLVSPDETVPGVSTYYATTCRECAAACGVIAETRDGRTIKLEGNPDHPLNRGALCAPRPVGAAGALQSRSPPHADGHAERAVEAHRVERRPHDGEPEARRGAQPQHRRRRRLSQSARERQLPGASSISGSAPSACSVTSAWTSKPTRRCSKPTAAATASRGRASSFAEAQLVDLVRRGLPGRLGRVGAAAARLRRRAREARHGAARRVRRTAPLAHRPQRRPVDSLQAGQRVGHRPGAARRRGAWGRDDRPGGRGQRRGGRRARRAGPANSRRPSRASCSPGCAPPTPSTSP